MRIQELENEVAEQSTRYDNLYASATDKLATATKELDSRDQLLKAATVCVRDLPRYLSTLGMPSPAEPAIHVWGLQNGYGFHGLGGWGAVPIKAGCGPHSTLGVQCHVFCLTCLLVESVFGEGVCGGEGRAVLWVRVGCSFHCW